MTAWQMGVALALSDTVWASEVETPLCAHTAGRMLGTMSALR